MESDELASHLPRIGWRFVFIQRTQHFLQEPGLRRLSRAIAAMQARLRGDQTMHQTVGGVRTEKSLSDSNVATRLPAQDLERARAFYAEKLGLEPIEERPGGLRYQCGSAYFSLFESAGVPSGEHTQMAWQVDDIDAVVAELRGRGVVFEDVDLPGLKTVDGIAEVSGNYPSAGGVGERAAWFRDSEGNLLGIGQPVH
jgi:catechol 2,3-dioxygenase-like lactoylglutathione lyase family enzyme